MTQPTTKQPMMQLSPPSKVAVVVHDARATGQRFWSYFGIGPFQFADWPPAGVSDFGSYWRGRPARWTVTLGTANLGALDLVLLQPTSAPSEYSIFLQEHGEGIHHLFFEADDLDATERVLQREGIEIAAGAPSRQPGMRWILTGPGPLGWAMEIRSRAAGAPRGTSPTAPARAKEEEQGAPEPCVRVGQLAQIGVVTDDVQRDAERMWACFGLGPWRFVEWPGDRSDLVGHFRGRRAKFELRLGLCEPGNIEIELIQPLQGKSLYSEFLARRGRGLHHLGFKVPHLGAQLDRLAQVGIKPLMTGSSILPGEKWVCLDTEKLIGWTLLMRGPVS